MPYSPSSASAAGRRGASTAARCAMGSGSGPATGSLGGSGRGMLDAPPAGMGGESFGCEQLPHEVALAESYEKLGVPIGEGTYGTVWRAQCRRTGQQVAMKKVVLKSEREGFPVTAIREVRALRRLSHPNIVCLVDVCAALPAPGTSNAVGDIYLIFEYAPSDLTGLLAYRKQKLKPPEIKCLVKQLANALDYCHMQQIMHRDLKPSNVLIMANGQLKLCDFGLSRTFEGAGNYSTRVITLWYRPPELLLGARYYDASVDVWSAGCIFGELLAGAALFPESSEGKVFQKIWERCGAHTEDAWPQELRILPQWGKLAPRSDSTLPKRDIFSDLGAKHGQVAVDLLRSTLQLDPNLRISAADILKHRFFSEEPWACQPSEIKMNPHLSCHELDVKRHREKLREEKEAQRLQGKRGRVDGGMLGGSAREENDGGRAASPKRPRAT
mmetsp:Transcript_118101/g.338789  ORF Transcript_118101/g.338789 Transcript_118101/m.338789 type:complete len:442 (-) Transcript_118101:503-1828(-)